MLTVSTRVSNRFKYALMNNEINFSVDSFKLAFMTPSFVFDDGIHEQWSVVSGEEISSGNGYTTGGIDIPVSMFIQDDVYDRGLFVSNNNKFITDGGPVGPIKSLIIYDHSNLIVAGCVNLSLEITLNNNDILNFAAIAFEIL